MKNIEYYNSINDRARTRLPSTKSLPQIIDEQCQLTPDAVAVVWEDKSQTYRQLAEKSNQLANYLAASGVKRGDLVGLCCNRDLDMPAWLVGILKTGAGYVPLDPDYPAERLAYMVENSGVKLIVAHCAQQDLIRNFQTNNLFLDQDRDAIESYGTDPFEIKARPEDVAYVIYTSGSTGKPKGVLVTNSNAVNFLLSMADWPGFTADDRILATTTLSFDISVVEMFLPLVSGGSVAVVDRATAKDNSRLVAAIEKYNVTFMQATPSMWRTIIDAEFKGGPQLKFVTGGEPLPRDLIQPMLDRCGELWNLYGPTETTVYCTGGRIFDADERILIGIPFANTELYIVDENNELCPPETRGEILLGGPLVAKGYLNRDELTAEKFVTFNGSRVYRSGDLGLITEEGLLEPLGRIDCQIKFHGHRIELGEIEAALATDPHVRGAAAVLREDRPGDQRLVGYVLPHSGQPIDTARLREMVAKSLPEYMVPSVIMVVDEFPHTPSGKLDRKSLPVPSTERPEIGTEYAAPKTDLETGLANIWGKILQIDAIGIQDNFFDLGGNSIRALEAVVQSRNELGIDVSNAEFFDNPTIEMLLGLADRKDRLREQLKSKNNSQENGSGQFAIIGMSARMPGAANLNEFWNNLVEGKESIRFFTSEELDPTLDASETSALNYVAARGIIENADQFDARFFAVPPKEAELIDPQQRIVLELAWTALEDAGIVPGADSHTIGIWAGTYATSYYINNVLSNPDIVAERGEFQVALYNEKDYIATRVAHKLNLTGPAINVNTACSTSAVALIEACQSLQLGYCDVALAGGVSIHFPQNSGHLHQAGSIFSPDGHCRPFDADAGGTLFCDGAGLVVVKRLEDAVSAGDRIYAVVKGFGINNDGGEKASFSAPSITGQAGAIAMAHHSAGITPDSVSYIETHGTATPVGDPIEVAALSTVFDAATSQRQFCAIGSVKSNIGHTVSAAGVAGIIKTALSLYHEVIPATLHYKQPNPQIDFASSPFFVCDKLKEWPRHDQPRRAGVSSFGVGGTNAHIVLEEAPSIVAPESANGLPIHLLPVSAQTEGALGAAVEQLANHLNQNPQLDLNDVCFTLQTGRKPLSHRAMIVADTLADAATILSNRKAPRFSQRKADATAREIVFMFPGQGSQYVRMGQNLYEQNETFRVNFDACCDMLVPLIGRDLRHVMFPPDDQVDQANEILKATQFTQPALFALGYSLAQVWLSWGFQPVALMGHSIGEFVAACVAGVFSLTDGLKMIAERGAAMQALPGGSMMSVRLSGAEVAPLLWGEMAIGSFNGPSLCVVSGPTGQVAELQKQLEAKDVVCRHLHTSHAFHSPMMESIVNPYSKFVGKFKLSAPSIPILSTVTGEWMTDEQATSPDYWAAHLRQPVRFSDAVTRAWSEDPTRILIELGPRKTLATLAKQHAADPQNQIALATLSDTSDDNAEWYSMLNAVGQLWLAGTEIDWKKISGNSGRTVSLPTYPFQRKRFFVEPGNLNRAAVPVAPASPNMSVTNSHLPHKTRSFQMSRLPNIVSAINQVFEDTSGLDLSEFDPGMTFFEMGLDSLVLTQTATALKKEFEVPVTFRQLLEETPNVELLAEFLDSQLPVESYASHEQIVEPVDQTSLEVQTNMPPETWITTPNQVQTQSVEQSPPAMPAVVASGAQSIIQQQLQLMAKQLQMLGATPNAPAQAPLTQAVAPTPAQPVPIQSAKQVAIVETSPDQGKEKSAGKTFGAGARVSLSDGSLTSEQQEALDYIIRTHNEMMSKSKEYAQTHRKYMADPRTVSGFRPNLKEMTHPIVVEKSKGVYLWDIDGNRYIDYTCGFGSNFLGHSRDFIVDAIASQAQIDFSIGPQSPLAGEVAALFCELTGNERMAFSNTGSEAVLGCTRLARAATGRDKIVMFHGDYHGILDEVIVRGSSKLKSFPAATGIPREHVENTLILDYGTNESLQIIRDNLDELAAILVEPVQSRRPELQPKEFLQELGRLTEHAETALIFDEVISGFRIGPGGAQEYFGVRADLASYGKVVGGGMPIGVVAGKAKYMDGLDGGFWKYGDESRPEAGMTYFAGTFVRHPITLAAAKAILEHIKQEGQPLYDRVNALADNMARQLNDLFKELDAPMFLAHFGTLFKVQFTEEPVYGELLFASLRRRGMHIWDHRPCLLTTSHTQEHVDQFVAAFRESIIEMQRWGFLAGEGYKKALQQFDAQLPPQQGAKVGKDRNGNAGWFIPDTYNPGQYIQIGVVG